MNPKKQIGAKAKAKAKAKAEAKAVVDTEDFVYEDHWGATVITATDLETSEPVIVNIQPEITEPMSLFDQLQRLADQGLIEIVNGEARGTAKAYDELERLRAGIGPRESGPEPETMTLGERFGYDIDRKLRFSF